MNPTPTVNDSLPFRPAGFSTLAEALDYAARGKTGFNFYSAKGDLAAVQSYAELRERAIRLARGLIAAGFAPESRVAIVADTTPDFMVLFFGCQYASLLAVPVALPTTLGGKEAYIAGLRRQIEGSGAVAAMAPDELVGYLREAAQGLALRLVGGAKDFLDLPARQADPRPFRAGGRCYLQYSSGSTREPLGVDIPQRALMANCHAIINHGLRAKSGDRCTSWLPLYHDMGLVGFMLTPMICQLSVDYIATRDFARRSLLWLSLISRNRGTLSYSPTFGYDLCARRAGTGGKLDLDLGCWRAAGVGGDMVQPGIVARFSEVFAPYGFRPQAFVPSYGMAETTLAVSFSPLDTGLIVDEIDRRQMAESGLAVPAPGAGAEKARPLVACGPVLPGHAAEVRGEDGKPLPERRIGRIHVKGPSVMDGYFGQPEATGRILSRDGWLDTGDLGYLLGGQLVITGRSKDLIIVNGRNIWPQDIEWAVEDLPALRRGDVAAFAVDGAGDQEEVVLLVQCRTADPDARAHLVREVEAVVQRTTALACKVFLIEPRGLPQTSSGKLSRAKAKAGYLNGAYGEPLAGHRAAPAAA
jgi:fatty-acyl-CoA synthase